MRGARKKSGVAVGRRFRGELGRDELRAAAAVVDDDLLAEISLSGALNIRPTISPAPPGG